MEKILNFLILVLAILGFFGGLGYLVWLHKFAICIGLGVVGYLAWPKFKENLDKLLN